MVSQFCVAEKNTPAGAGAFWEWSKLMRQLVAETHITPWVFGF
jgi:hypothetical protein